MRIVSLTAIGFLVGCLVAGVPRVAAETAASTKHPQPELAEILVAGREHAIEPAPEEMPGSALVYGALGVKQSELPLSLRIVSRGGDSRPVVRLITRLFDLESNWKDRDGMMWLVLRFLDADNHAVSSVSFPRRGETPGWKGIPQGSPFHLSKENAVVPEGARKVQLLLVSGGTPRTTGFWAVRRLRIFAATPGNGKPAQEIYALDHLEGTNLQSRRGNPNGWSRDGTSLATPQVVSLEGEDVQPMLALIDVDPNNTGGWLASVNDAIPVEPGMQLQLECDEIHSIGRGGDDTVTFRSLPVGDYVFEAQAADEFGRASGPSLRIPVHVLPPFFQTTGFKMAVASVVLVLLLGLWRYRTWREMQRLERKHAIEQERTRIARDIHDEMGSRLTQISILAAQIQPKGGGANSANPAVTEIQNATRDLVTSLDEIVWAVNPKLDTLEGLGNYISHYSETVLRSAGLRCRLDIPAILAPRLISSGIRHRFMLAVKEALTNVLKHAAASEVRISLTFVDDWLEATISDNGEGFDAKQVVRGNGLENLRQRLSEMGGACTIESAIGGGTSVRLRLPLPPEEAIT